ncbi:MAG: flagellar basal body-associated protein FliL [Gammaproteobacteria bacterium]
MADDTDDLSLDLGKKEEAGAEGGGGKSNKNKLLIIGLAVWLVIFMGVVVFLVMKLKQPAEKTERGKPKEKQEAKQEEQKFEEVKDETPKEEAAAESADSHSEGGGKEGEKSASKSKWKYFDVKPTFVVNVQTTSRNPKFLQAQVVVMVDNDAAIASLKNNLPLIKNNLALLFSSKRYDELLTLEGKEQLRQQALKEVKKILEADGKKGVESVLFESFVMQ